MPKTLVGSCIMLIFFTLITECSFSLQFFSFSLGILFWERFHHAGFGLCLIDLDEEFEKVGHVRGQAQRNGQGGRWVFSIEQMDRVSFGFCSSCMRDCLLVKHAEPEGARPPSGTSTQPEFCAGFFPYIISTLGIRTQELKPLYFLKIQKLGVREFNMPKFMQLINANVIFIKDWRSDSEPRLHHRTVSTQVWSYLWLVERFGKGRFHFLLHKWR